MQFSGLLLCRYRFLRPKAQSVHWMLKSNTHTCDNLTCALIHCLFSFCAILYCFVNSPCRLQCAILNHMFQAFLITLSMVAQYADVCNVFTLQYIKKLWWALERLKVTIYRPTVFIVGQCASHYNKLTYIQRLEHDGGETTRGIADEVALLAGLLANSRDIRYDKFASHQCIVLSCVYHMLIMNMTLQQPAFMLLLKKE